LNPKGHVFRLLERNSISKNEYFNLLNLIGKAKELSDFLY